MWTILAPWGRGTQGQLLLSALSHLSVRHWNLAK